MLSGRLDAGGVEGAVRLVDSREEDGVTIGIPQIFHAGAWGTFCDGDVDAYDYDDGLTEVIPCGLIYQCE